MVEVFSKMDLTEVREWLINKPMIVADPVYE